MPRQCGPQSVPEFKRATPHPSVVRRSSSRRFHPAALKEMLERKPEASTVRNYRAAMLK